MDSTKKLPSPLLALLPIALLAGMLFATINTFGSDALNGGSQISLLATTACCAFIAMVFYRVPWKDFERCITNNITNVATALIILLIIGALSGIWMISGVVPTLIYYGMEIIQPSFFLASTCLICVLVSETTILAASVTNTPLFRHIRYMMITTIPSLLISLLLFTIMGLTHDNSSSTQEMQIFASGLAAKFNITPWLLLVPVITGILIARKVPSIITLLISTLLACVAAVIFQPDLVREVAGENSLFKGIMMTCYGTTSLQTDNAMLSELVATRGMSGMMNTVWLILCAMCFGGAMTASGMLESITSLSTRFIKNRVSTVTSTVFSGLFFNLATADQYISIIMSCNMFGNIYKRQGYESRLLSRTTEDAVTVTSVLIPWNTCGMTQATILNVSTLTYLPFCFFNIISPLMSIFIAIIGYKIVRNAPEESSEEEVTTEQ